jgi:hypothetical protein
LAYAFYGQGTRFLDAGDPTDIRQVGYFRPDDANTWAAYWHDGYVFVADNGRGVDILKFHDLETADFVIAPDRLGRTANRPDPLTGYLCPLKPSL